MGGITQTNYALDAAMGLAEVIFTSPSTSSGQVEGHAYLHLPGVVATEAASGTRRYLLSDGLGSVRQVTDETGQVVAYQEFDPYGNPLTNGGDPYGYTGEWWQADIGLLHLRARWYEPQSGTFLSRDAVESEPPYLYVRGNVTNWVDPSGNAPECGLIGPVRCRMKISGVDLTKSYGIDGYVITQCTRSTDDDWENLWGAKHSVQICIQRERESWVITRIMLTSDAKSW